jgi:phosphate transport system substrate-binding protein
MRQAWRVGIGICAMALVATACGGTQPSGTQGTEEAEAGALSGTIEIDGSSTVEPLTVAVAEEYRNEAPDVVVNVGRSGTGGGFERFCGTGDIQIADASRAIEQDEADLCAQNGIEYIELQVGSDALTMVVNPDVEFAECLTTEEVQKIWGPEGATSWDRVRPDFPAEPLVVFAPGADSGTYDFFNEVVLQPAGIEQPRQDYNSSEDDNIIAQGVIGTPGAWGYFGYAFFQASADQLKALSYDAGDGCVAPSEETAQDGSYKLTRPLFIYVRTDALAEPHIADFVTFYLDNVNSIIGDVGYISEPEADLGEAKAALEEAISAAG